MNEPEYERTFNISSLTDRCDYAVYLWATSWRPKVQREQSVQQEPSRKPSRGVKRFPLPEKKGREVWEETRYNRWEIYREPDAMFSVPERVLLSTGTKASDWQKRQSPEPRKRKDKGTAKGSGQVALQSVRKANKSNRTKDTDLSNYADGDRWY
jgi:hypothetical protein